MCGGGIGKIFKSLLPILGGLAGSAILPGFGTALGLGGLGELGAGALSTGLGAAGGEALAGGNLKEDLLAGATGAAGSALTGSGILDSIGSGVSDAASAAGSALGLTGDGGLFSSASPGSLSTGPVGTAPSASAGAGAGVGGPAGGALSASAPSSIASAGGIGGDVTADLEKASGGFNTDFGKMLTSLGGGSATGGTTGATPTAAAGSSGINGILKKLTSPDALLSGAGLAGNLIMGNKPVAGEGALSSQAAQLGAQGQQLSSYLDKGTLPPGMQNSLNQASESAKASIKSQYASKGMSGSSAEQQDLAHVDQAMQAQGAELAMSLLQQGVSESNLSSQLYKGIMDNALKQDESLGTAFSSFASSLAGGGTSGGTKGTITFG